jgi:hypothetical protein
MLNAIPRAMSVKHVATPAGKPRGHASKTMSTSDCSRVALANVRMTSAAADRSVASLRIAVVAANQSGSVSPGRATGNATANGTATTTAARTVD